MKLAMEDILLINALETVSRVSAKDCIIRGDIISFLVNEKEIGKAIGKKAENMKELEKKLKKRIEIVGFYEEPQNMVKNTFDVEIISTSKKNGKLILGLDNTSKKKVFSNSGRLKRVKELIERNYGLNLIIV